MRQFLYFSIFFITISSCTSDGDESSLEIPVSYSFERNGVSTVHFSGQTTRIKMGEELIVALQDPSMSLSGLLELYRNEDSQGNDVNPFIDSELNSSTKSIRSKVAASADYFSTNTIESIKIKQDFEQWIQGQVEEIFPSWNMLAAPGQAGQIADESAVRYVNGLGVEYNQVINKGLIGALMVDQMINNYLSPKVLDEGDNRVKNDAGETETGKPYTTMEHKWDEAYGYLFGNAPDASIPLSTIGGDDNFLNKYLARVENDSDFSGIANIIYTAFKTGRAAIVEGKYNIRDQQSDIIKKEVSKIIGIRAVYYLQQGKNQINISKGGAFHDLSEGLGFIYSLQFTQDPQIQDPYLNSVEVRKILDDLLLEEHEGFWNITEGQLDLISHQIAGRFDFTVDMAGS